MAAQDRFTVQFTVNTDKIIGTDFENRIVPYINSKSSQIEGILVIGSSSPEGNKKRNEELAKKRAEKIASYFSTDNIYILASSELFHQKTLAEEYEKLRAVYIEVYYSKTDTVTVRDTVYKEVITTTIKEVPIIEDTAHFSIYNNLIEDIVGCGNIGLEFYFGKWSAFIDASFFNKYRLWNTGFRRYFGNWFGEGGISFGKCDYKFIGLDAGIGYKFDLVGPWKLYPVIRLGTGLLYVEKQQRSGNIQISFGEYTETWNNTVPVNEKGELYKNKYRGYWFGPTYVGLTIQRDFTFIKRKKND